MTAPDIQPKLDAISLAYNIPHEDILGKSRLPHVVRARFAFWHALRADGFSWPVIARAVGRGGDHSSVRRGVLVHEARLNPSPPVMPSGAALVSCEEVAA